MKRLRVIGSRDLKALIVPAILLVATLATVTACASLSPSRKMQSWMGSTAQQLILSWGPPTRTSSDGAGGSILIYEYDRNMGQVPGLAVQNADGSVSYTAPQRSGYVASRMFWVNSGGLIYNWRWQGF
jgi:hypothetical protein